MKRKKVFISSTYLDLKPHRSKVWDILKKNDFDIIGMEDFGARSESPLSTCLGEIERCDIYIGIIGFRLGSLNKVSQKSITQLEYEKANELNKNIFIYIIDEEQSKNLLKNIDTGDKADKLRYFKKILKENHTVDSFIDENDLGEKIELRLNKLLAKRKKTTKQILLSSQQILEEFSIAPKSYSGKELLIQIEINPDEKPFACSKELCNLYQLEFGESIILPIKLLQPDSQLFSKLYLKYEDLILFQREKKTTFEIIVKLLFSSSSPKHEDAAFTDKYKLNQMLTNSSYWGIEKPELFSKVREAEGHLGIQFVREGK